MSEFLALLSSIHPVLVGLMICAGKVIEISIQSLKTCLMVKGQRGRAAMLGFLEAAVWGLVISTIISTLGDNLMLLAFYCVGYATGLYIGSSLESRLALGTSNIEIIANQENTQKIVEYLKKYNKGFTVLSGYGATGQMNMIYIVLSRKEVNKTIKEINAIADGHTFVTASEISKYAGGYGIMK